jgi:hypothetical protein
MVADPNKLPKADDWFRILEEDFSRQLIHSYETTPGTISLQQRVNGWELERKPR